MLGHYRSKIIRARHHDNQAANQLIATAILLNILRLELIDGHLSHYNQSFYPTVDLIIQLDRNVAPQNFVESYSVDYLSNLLKSEHHSQHSELIVN